VSRFKAHLMQEVELFSLHDRLTGVEVHKFTLGRNYHWYILWALALIKLAVQYL
jgi:hypothetical protein